jgi:glycosyltransferase involved in cell wall biosynthesis
VKPKILILLAYYIPSMKSGGPIRSISNLVESLGDEMDFHVVTSDRDVDGGKPHDGVVPDTWMEVGKAKVLYLSPERLRAASMSRFLASEKADVLYVNSFFSPRFSIVPLLARAAGARGQRSVVLAPRGEFSPGALRLKSSRKQIYLQVAKRLSVYRDVVWHASSAFEEQDIRRAFGAGVRVRVALPFSAPDRQASQSAVSTAKTPGELRVAFVSRIVPKKNLLDAINMLNGVQGQIRLNIFGPAEDLSYWSKCEAAIRALPQNVTVEFKSLIEHSMVAEALSTHHLFLFPTLGENYGHVIHEALSSGCMALISDRTPWRGLERSGAGWDLPLDQPQLFRAALDRCVSMTNEQFQLASSQARAFARDFADGQSLLAANRAVFAPDLPGGQSGADAATEPVSRGIEKVDRTA